MLRLTNEMIAIKKNGEIILFSNRKEYDAFIKTKEIKQCVHLFAYPKVLADDLRKFSKLVRLAEKMERMGGETSEILMEILNS